MPLRLPHLHSITSSENDTSVLCSAVRGSGSRPSLSSPISAAASGDASSPLAQASLPSLHSVFYRINPSPTLSSSLLSILSPCSPAATAPALAISAFSLLYSVTQLSLSVYDLSTLRQIESVPSPSAAGATKSLSISTDGSTLFTAHQDGRICVYRRSPRSGLHRLFTTLPTTTDCLLRLPYPKNHVTIHRHRKRLWIHHSDAVSSLAFSGSGYLYSASWDKTLKIWSASGLRCVESISAHDDAVNAVAVAADGTVYTGSADWRIRIWARPAEGKRHENLATLERHRSAVNALALNADGSVLYSGACDRSILVWERQETAEYMAVTGELRGHENAILSLVCVGDVVVSGSGDRTVRIWKRGAEGSGIYSCLRVMEGHAKGIRSLVALRVPVAGGDCTEEYRVCSGSLDGEVRVWQVRVLAG